MGANNNTQISRKNAEKLIVQTHSEFSFVLGRLNTMAGNRGIPEARRIREIYTNYLQMYGRVGGGDMENRVSRVLQPELERASIHELNEMLNECQELANLYELQVQRDLRAFGRLAPALTDHNLGTRHRTDADSYLSWVNEYYDLSNRSKTLEAEIEIRKNRLRFNNLSNILQSIDNRRQLREEISIRETELVEINALLPHSIHRINTHFFFDNAFNRQFITIEDGQQIKGHNNSGQTRRIELQLISDWGPVFSMIAIAGGKFTLGLTIGVFVFASDFTHDLNILRETGDWPLFLRTLAERFAIQLLARGANDIAIMNLTKGMGQNELVKKIGEAFETLFSTTGSQFIEAMRGDTNGR